MPNEPAIPDIHADLVQIVSTEFGIILGLRALSFPHAMQADEQGSEDEDVHPELKGIVRLSPTQAKIFAIMLKRALKELEDQDGTIPLPSGFIEQVRPTQDEW
ncbi:MAG: hypothetical protein OXL37_00085 [Chloroflexota bacterium]|nr:hypothetical protein [Chloroflexota bacterium]MDE2959431.1 hypothetical protein [Chloroflexota bacterium]